MTKLLITVFSLVASTAAFAEGSCSKAELMHAVHKTYGHAYNFASGNEQGSTEASFVQHENSDQYVFWVDKSGNTFKAVVTTDSGSCTNVRAWVDVNNGQ